MNIIQLNLNTSEIEDAPEVSSYLKSGSTFLAAAGLDQDTKDPSKGNAVPIGWATDGANVWPLSLQYYIDNYKIGIDEQFLTEIRTRNYQCPSVDEDKLTMIKDEFTKQTFTDSETSLIPSGDPDSNPFR
jgi:hypothetical protein